MALQHFADAPGVSQIVYPFGPDGDPDDGVQYMRVLDRRCMLLIIAHTWRSLASF